MKGLEIDKAEVLQAMQDFNNEDGERASDAGESRQRIGAFLENTGINNKAFAHCRAMLRQKKDDKRQDWLRSMEALMPLMREQIAAIGTRDAFDVPAEAKAAAAETTADDLRDDGFPDDDFEIPDEEEDAPADAEIAAESDAFEEEVAKYEGNVKPFAAKRSRKSKVAAE